MAFSADATFDPVHLLVAALALAGSIISFLARRSVSDIDKRQDKSEKQIGDIRSELKGDAASEWTRHDAEHTSIHEENEAEHRRIRGDIASNSEDISRLLERTKDL